MVSTSHSTNDSQDGRFEEAALLGDIELAPITNSMRTISDSLAVPTVYQKEQVFCDKFVKTRLKLTSHRSLRFGSIQIFTPWFPEVNPNEKRAQTWRTWWSDRRTALGAHQAVSLLVLTVNLALTIYALRTSKIVNSIRTIRVGDCSNMQRLNSFLHILINGLSTTLLGPSNYCMQLLVAPTRAEVDRAHKQQRWMDIGLPSIRNLRQIGWKRQIGWIMLALSSGTLHLLWNSAVFSSFPYVTYDVAIVTSDYFTNNIAWSISSTSATADLQIIGRSFPRLNTTECIQRYADQLGGAGHLVIVTVAENNNVIYDNGSSLIYTFGLAPGDDWSSINDWLCLSYLKTASSSSLQEAFLLEQKTWKVGKKEVAVDHCLSAGVTELDDKCGLYFSVWIILMDTRSLVTIGDAIASFLANEDSTTQRMCLAGVGDFGPKKWFTNSRRWRGPKSARMFSLASPRRWLITIGFALLIIGLSLMTDSLVHLHMDKNSISLKSLWNYGFSNTRFLVFLFVQTSPSQFWLAVSFANSWQLEVSCLYLLYNATLTTLCVAEEWSHFGLERKFLRVSAPKGMQKSTYFLSLPFRYGIPLAAFMSLLHWCISQSIFLERAEALWPDGTRRHDADSSRIGYSTMGLIITVVVGALFILGLVGLGFRKVAFHMPIVSTNSAAISAATHCPKEDVDAALLPVKWGVVDIPTVFSPGRCCFTTANDVDEPKIGLSYT